MSDVATDQQSERGGEAGDAVLTVTDAAREAVVSVRAEEAEPETLALWVSVSGASGGTYTYDMWFQTTSEAGPDDVRSDSGDLPVVVSAGSVAQLRGAELDVDPSGGLVIRNPNRPPAPGAPSDLPPLDAADPVVVRIQDVLDRQINPSIASHGGQASLVAWEAGTAYLMLGGGCQGCGLAKVTLSQGIEVALKEAVPEVVSVVDVTDHASGDNPFYAASGK